MCFEVFVWCEVFSRVIDSIWKLERWMKTLACHVATEETVALHSLGRSAAEQQLLEKLCDFVQQGQHTEARFSHVCHWLNWRNYCLKCRKEGMFDCLTSHTYYCTALIADVSWSTPHCINIDVASRCLPVQACCRLGPWSKCWRNMIETQSMLFQRWYLYQIQSYK